MNSKLTKLIDDYRLLLSSVPALVTTFFVLSVVLMNLMANRIIFQIGDLVACDGGFLLSWIPFLCSDSVTKHFGSKAAIMLNVFAAGVNVACVILFAIVAHCPGNGEDFSAFDSIFGCTWFIVVGSMLAFIVSGVINSLVNSALGKIVTGDSRKAFFARSYISTFVGQFIDNLIFATFVYYLCAPIFWGFGLPFSACMGSAILGSILELVMEALFGEVGYKTCKRWKSQGIGKEWNIKYSQEQ